VYIKATHVRERGEEKKLISHAIILMHFLIYFYHNLGH